MPRNSNKWKSKITVFGERWRVRLVPQSELTPGTYGEYDPDRRHINVWIGLKGRARWRVLLHELMHIAWRNAHGENGVHIDIEETVVGALTTGPDVSLFEILHANYDFGEDF